MADLVKNVLLSAGLYCPLSVAWDYTGVAMREISKKLFLVSGALLMEVCKTES